LTDPTDACDVSDVAAPADPTRPSGSDRATFKARLEGRLHQLWFTPVPGRFDRLLRLALTPLSGLVRSFARRQRQAIALDKALHPPQGRAPRVVIIGNLITGGTGKTPLIGALAQALEQRGWRVGLLARGHGGRHSARSVCVLPMPVLPDTAQDWGDEAVLLARQTGLPVAVGHDRRAALQALLAHHACEVVLSDDGLQHRGLHRDLEIAVFDARGAGNGRVLPAGPLREPLAHALLMDALALNGAQTPAPVVHSRVFRFEVQTQACRPLDGGPEVGLEALARTMASRRVHALAGIGQPQRFFKALSAAGFRPRCWVLADHQPIDAGWAGALEADCLLMTSKDAVKCHDWPPGLRARSFEVTAQALIAPSFVDWLEERLRGSKIA
jgi:tetraacyldisaccharide 4'-kinase